MSLTERDNEKTGVKDGLEEIGRGEPGELHFGFAERA